MNRHVFTWKVGEQPAAVQWSGILDAIKDGWHLLPSECMEIGGLVFLTLAKE